MPKQSQILIVDDDPDIRQVLRLLLEGDFTLFDAPDGQSALALLRENKNIDLVILDVMMPGMDGYATCDALREFSNAPVLFLTAKSAESDRLSAYRSGGDDFLSKPFSKAELLAKVSSLLRRYKEYRGKPEEALAIENLEVDFASRTVVSSGKSVLLTDTEFSILEYLLRHRGDTSQFLPEGVVVFFDQQIVVANDLPRIVIHKPSLPCSADRIAAVRQRADFRPSDTVGYGCSVYRERSFQSAPFAARDSDNARGRFPGSAARVFPSARRRNKPCQTPWRPAAAGYRGIRPPRRPKDFSAAHSEARRFSPA